uniref:Uncharacterized protein n=1 Tax=Oryza rufipogon TaxID=4529 RepID=A0A0E0MTQ7_ORYRU
MGGSGRRAALGGGGGRDLGGGGELGADRVDLPASPCAASGRGREHVAVKVGDAARQGEARRAEREVGKGKVNREVAKWRVEGRGRGVEWADRVVAAHHGSILFRTRVPFADPDFVAPGHFPVDCFVYTAGATAASPPSLTQLPRCFIDGFSDPVEDEYYKPYQLQRQQIMLDENIGFLSYSGDGGHEFMVADIRNYHGDSLELCIFNHHASSPSPSPSPEQWRIQRLEMHHASACKIGHSKKQLSDG